ncbi:MAG: ABC transporter ATP-binding protein [Planctomycetota bacterium]
MTPLVALEGIAKRFGRVRALDTVTLDVGPGITGLLGPNGAGKTTLVKILLGLLRATSGTGTVLGRRLWSESRAIREEVGYLPEDDCTIPGLSGVEAVAFSAQLSGIRRLEALRRAHEILDFCGVEEERYREVAKYSTGMRQKLKFAQAIVHDPKLLVLDEPTSGLDPEERRDLLERVRTLARRAGKAVILSTHILPDVQATCDAVVILVRGSVRVVERVDVLTRPASPTYYVRAVGAPAPLAERLRRAGYAADLEPDGAVRVETRDEAFPERVWDAIRGSGLAIRSLVPARTSLEEIFLKAVRGPSDAHP